MAEYVQISKRFWRDDYIAEELPSPEEKLLFIHLLSNEYVNLIGIYKLSIRAIAYDTGISADRIKELLDKFSRDNKIKYIQNHIVLLNFHKNVSYNNPMIRKHVINQLESIPNEIKTECKPSIDALMLKANPLQTQGKPIRDALETQGKPITNNGKNQTISNASPMDKQCVTNETRTIPNLSYPNPNPNTNTNTNQDPIPPIPPGGHPSQIEKYIWDYSGGYKKAILNPAYQGSDRIGSGQVTNSSFGSGSDRVGSGQEEIKTDNSQINPDEWNEILKISKEQYAELCREFGDAALDLMSIVDDWILTQPGFKVKSPLKLCQKFGRNILKEKGVIKWQP